MELLQTKRLPLSQKILRDATLYRVLLAVDDDLAAQVHTAGCPCGGRLRAPSPLSPRRVRRAGGTILSMPRGPSDVRTASATALAATMLLSRTLPGAQTKSASWGVATPEASGGRAEPQLAGEGEAAGKASAGSRRSGVLRPEPPARCDQSAPVWPGRSLCGRACNARRRRRQVARTSSPARGQLSCALSGAQQEPTCCGVALLRQPRRGR